MRIRKENSFISFFDEKTGKYIRTGILKNGVDTGLDPFMSSFPELIDVGIMGHCIHGKKGLCIKAGVECYQDGLHSQKANMTLENFRKLVFECKDNTYQFALGGCGDPDEHEHFEEILKICEENHIVANFTTSGLGMTSKKAELCKKYCGAVAVSWYHSDYTIKAIKLLLDKKVKTNIHYVLNTDTIDEALNRLKNRGFPFGINAIVFLLHKPVGLGSFSKVITLKNKKFCELIEYISMKKQFYKIGFDSCSVPMLINHSGNIDLDSLDTCEGARWSAYITSDFKMLPCSFDSQEQKWAVDLNKYSVREAWNSENFKRFRTHFKKACPSCSKRKHCFGGCPIVPEIVLCKDKK